MCVVEKSIESKRVTFSLVIIQVLLIIEEKVTLLSDLIYRSFPFFNYCIGNYAPRSLCSESAKRLPTKNVEAKTKGEKHEFI